MTETNQVNLDGKKLPDVSMEEETKLYDVYRTRHLILKLEREAFNLFTERLDKRVEKRKISVSDKARYIKAYLQAKARMLSAKAPLTEGIWDKETQQLHDEIVP